MKYVVTARAPPDMVRFLYEQTGCDLRGHNLDSPRWFCVTVRHPLSAEVVAALACEFVQPWEATFTCAVADPDAVTRRLLTGIFKALFTRARRLTAHVEAHDHQAEDTAKRLGFVYEGFSRLGYDGSRDALVYGMLPEDCRYLPGVRATRPDGGPDAPAIPARSLPAGVGTAERQRRVSGGKRYN